MKMIKLAKTSKKLFTYGIIFMIMFLGSCNSTKPEPKGPEEPNWDWSWGLRVELSEATELQIRQDYLEKYVLPEFPEATKEDVWIEEYYGTYFGTHVPVMMNSTYWDYDDIKWEISIGRVFFKFKNENKIIIWSAGTFYELDFWRGYPDLRSVVNYHRGMSGELEKQIQQYIYDIYPEITELLSPKYVWFQHYGIYGNYIPVYIGLAASPGREIIIDGILFEFGNLINDIYVICTKEWQHYGLSDAYEQGLINYEDLVNIAYHHSHGNIQYVNGGKK